MATRRSTSKPTVLESKLSNGENDMRATTHLTLSILRNLLSVEDPVSKCHGHTKNGARCQAPVSEPSRKTITSLLKAIIEAHNSGMSIIASLSTVSGLVHCKRFHQNQAPSKLRSWLASFQAWEDQYNLEHLKAVDVEEASEPICDPGRTVFTQGTVKTEVKSVTSAKLETPLFLLSVLPTEKIRIKSISAAICADADPIASRTRSRLASQSQPCPEFLPSKFIPYHNTSRLNDKIFLTQLLKPFTKTEHLPGYVYVFSRPNTPGMFKIGTTKKSPAQRLSSLGNNCKYRPDLRFSIGCKYARRLENLVHAYFCNERRKETSAQGRCNDGRGCTTEHREWFDVNLSRVITILRKIAVWIDEQNPYSDGLLQDMWQRKARLPSSSTGHTDDNWQEFFCSNIKSSGVRREVVLPENRPRTIPFTTHNDLVYASSFRKVANSSRDPSTQSATAVAPETTDELVERIVRRFLASKQVYAESVSNYPGQRSFEASYERPHLDVIRPIVAC